MASENTSITLFETTPTLTVKGDARYFVPTGIPGLGAVEVSGADIAKDVKRALALKIKKLVGDRWDASMAAAARDAVVKKG